MKREKAKEPIYKVTYTVPGYKRSVLYTYGKGPSVNRDGMTVVYSTDPEKAAQARVRADMEIIMHMIWGQTDSDKGSVCIERLYDE